MEWQLGEEVTGYQLFYRKSEQEPWKWLTQPFMDVKYIVDVPENAKSPHWFAVRALTSTQESELSEGVCMDIDKRPSLHRGIK